MTRKYKSDAFASIHETMEDLHRAKIIDKQTMRKFDEACLTPIREFTPQEIYKLRMREKVSQEVFERHLNVTKGLVSKWERGDKHPAGPSLKLLNLIDKKGLSAVA